MRETCPSSELSHARVFFYRGNGSEPNRCNRSVTSVTSLIDQFGWFGNRNRPGPVPTVTAVTDWLPIVKNPGPCMHAQH
jgi:hypothetical protein